MIGCALVKFAKYHREKKIEIWYDPQAGQPLILEVCEVYRTLQQVCLKQRGLCSTCRHSPRE